MVIADGLKDMADAVKDDAGGGDDGWTLVGGQVVGVGPLDHLLPAEGALTGLGAVEVEALVLEAQGLLEVAGHDEAAEAGALEDVEGAKEVGALAERHGGDLFGEAGGLAHGPGGAMALAGIEVIDVALEARRLLRGAPGGLEEAMAMVGGAVVKGLIEDLVGVELGDVGRLGDGLSHDGDIKGDGFGASVGLGGALLEVGHQRSGGVGVGGHAVGHRETPCER